MRSPRLSGGQAMVEALYGIAALAIVLLLLAQIDRLQDIGLRATHASRHLALSLTRRDPGRDVENNARVRFFEGRQRHWVARDGTAMIDASTASAHIGQHEVAASSAVLVGAAPQAALRDELLGTRSGISVAVITPRPSLASERAATAATDVLGLRAWDEMRLAIRRHTAVLAGAGHGQSDRDVSDRLARSPSAWQTAAAGSQAAGRRVASAMRGVDAAWGRPQPEFEWLRAWEDVIPEDRVGAGERQ